jgi:hypothetical protein
MNSETLRNLEGLTSVPMPMHPLDESAAIEGVPNFTGYL